MELTELLDNRGITWKKTNNPYEILISCTGGDHADTSPSLSYNLEKDLFHCWSCGFSGGKTKFMASIGETVILDSDSKQPYRLRKLKTKLQKLVEEDDIKLPNDRRLFAEQFKGIGIKTLKSFNAFTTVDEKLQLNDYVCFPIYQHGRLKFIEGRLNRTDLPNQPKYYRRPANVEAGDCLFPIDKIKNTSYVILVEGLFDMLNMWQYGYTNTLCIFGAYNFTRKNLDMLDKIGTTRVDIMMDSDAAGQRAAEKIAKSLDSRDIYSRIIKLPPGKDPGELTHIEIERLLK